MKKPVKEPDVGPKELEVGYGPINELILVTFPSSIAYNRFVDEIREADLSVAEGSKRVDLCNSQINAVIFPIGALDPVGRQSPLIAIRATLGNGHVFEIPIVGENRFRICYKMLKELIGRKPEPDQYEDAPFLRVPQDENRAAYIRHRAPIVGLVSWYKYIPEEHAADEADTTSPG